MEDVDAAFYNAVNRSSEDQDVQSGFHAGPFGPPTSRVTLSGLLNALDGLAAQEGRILFATTNRYKALDPALTRPGRMDIHIEFKHASRYQAEELYKSFYMSGHGNGTTLGSAEKSDVVGGALSECAPLLIDPGSESFGSSSASGLPQGHQPPRLSRAVYLSLAIQFRVAAAIPQRTLSVASL